MFENTTNFDFDDDEMLSTSFTPVSSSTQPAQTTKRQNEEPEGIAQKKPKPDFHFVLHKNTNVKNTFTRTLSDRITEATFSSPNKIVKRKFPGPAGLLPERTESNKSILELIADENSEKDDTNDYAFLCSQRTVSTFEDGPWMQMSKDFCTSSGERLYEKFTIAWIKKQASLKMLLVNHKAPFLAAVIQSLEIYDGKVPTVNVMLKDVTGDIQGTILHSLYEDYSNFFTIGSVLVLKQFGVLSAGYNNHCLTITPNNLLTIYCLQVPQTLPNEECRAEQSGLVKKIEVQKCVADDIVEKYNSDSLENFVLREKQINFARLNSFTRNKSEGNCNSLGSNKLLPSRNLDLPNRVESSLNSSVNNISNCNRPSDNSLRKNYIFRRDVSNNNSENCLSPLSRLLTECSDVSQEGSLSSKTNEQITKNNILVKGNSPEQTKMLKDLFEGVDTDSLFDDF